MRFRFRVLFLLLILISGRPVQAAPPDDDPAERLRRLPPMDQDEVLWLARCIYSESDRPEEQRLVAWVVRNRKETAFRGDTYREVVLEPKQFSAFNDPSPRRTYILGLDARDAGTAWQKALAIALEVYEAPASHRPFPITVRHFYSPVSMNQGAPPDWARQVPPLDARSLNVDPERFRFFDGIDETRDPPPPGVTGRIAELRTHTATQKVNLRNRFRRPRLSGRVPRPARPTMRRSTGQ